MKSHRVTEWDVAKASYADRKESVSGWHAFIEIGYLSRHRESQILEENRPSPELH